MEIVVFSRMDIFIAFEEYMFWFDAADEIFTSLPGNIFISFEKFQDGDSQENCYNILDGSFYKVTSDYDSIIILLNLK